MKDSEAIRAKQKDSEAIRAKQKDSATRAKQSTHVANHSLWHHKRHHKRSRHESANTKEKLKAKKLGDTLVCLETKHERPNMRVRQGVSAPSNFAWEMPELRRATVAKRTAQDTGMNATHRDARRHNRHQMTFNQNLSWETNLRQTTMKIKQR
jgi:ribosomal protein L13E